ncbi:Receptor-type tyrosine-protein phosphatase V [Holothuria leucospilota]|uniref:Receptor-type tyrosine-protein phosphatase V n=1 Tax=Holothuria leucospilota TaxID=206669 RepID=A0A9Q1C8X4_HOLLE|nr:Receptor-type tyrosine-protein phosphatase V [Holothuria leucospilota]
MARFVLFVELVKEYLAETNEQGSLLVHCMNGVGRSGIFCAVLSCLKQFDSLGGVDVVQTVKQLKQCQPLFIRTEEEFCLIYDLITLYVSPEACLEQAEMYANLPTASSTEQLDSEILYENLGFKTEGGRPLSNSEVMPAESTA